MREFARCCVRLGETTSTAERTALLAAHLSRCDPESAALATWLLLGHRPRRSTTSGELRAWAAESAGIPEWLFAASRDSVGDTAETIALLLPEPPPDATPPPLVEFHRRFVVELAALPPAERRRRVEEAWSCLDADGRFVYHKILGGGFRIGVSKGLVHRAVAEATGATAARVADRLVGRWMPSAALWRGLAENAGDPEIRGAEPLPFCLAQDLALPTTELADALGDCAGWQIEWKFDGLRGQLVSRSGAVALWSRGEERLDRAFPEIAALGRALPAGTVLDGEITIWEGSALLPFSEVQRRIGRRRVEASLFDRRRARLVAYDLLEEAGEDLRHLPTHERRRRLEALLAGLDPEAVERSPLIEAADWAAIARLRSESRSRGVEGVMLKRRDAPYTAGRAGSGWLKWKADPFSADLVVVAALPGSGRRANLLSDYTLAGRGGDGDEAPLVTVAKAYSGLSDREIAELDRTLRRSTRQRRGALRIVEPTVVLEIGFEGIAESPRHKAGLALRFPRILRWRRDKAPRDADSIESLRRLLHTTRAGAAGIAPLRTGASD